MGAPFLNGIASLDRIAIRLFIELARRTSRKVYLHKGMIQYADPPLQYEFLSLYIMYYFRISLQCILGFFYYEETCQNVACTYLCVSHSTFGETYLTLTREMSKSPHLCPSATAITALGQASGNHLVQCILIAKKQRNSCFFGTVFRFFRTSVPLWYSASL